MDDESTFTALILDFSKRSVDKCAMLTSRRQGALTSFGLGVAALAILERNWITPIRVIRKMKNERLFNLEY